MLLFVAFVRSRYPNADIVVDGVTYLPQDGEHTTNIGTSATKRAPEGMTLEDRRRYEGITRRHIRPLVGHAFFEPRAGRSDLAGPATSRAHRDASDRTRSAVGLDRATQTARKLSRTTRRYAAGRGPHRGRRVVATGLSFAEVGLHQCPSEKQGQTKSGRSQLVPFSRPEPAPQPRLWSPASAGPRRDGLVAGGRWIRNIGSATG